MKDNIGPKAGRWAQISKAAIFDKRLSAGALRVLCALTTYAGQDATCWPSVSTIARRIGLTPRAVQGHLRALETCEYVRTQAQQRLHRGGQAVNRYLLLYPALPATDEGAQNDGVKISSPRPEETGENSQIDPPSEPDGVKKNDLRGEKKRPDRGEEIFTLTNLSYEQDLKLSNLGAPEKKTDQGNVIAFPVKAEPAPTEKAASKEFIEACQHLTDLVGKNAATTCLQDADLTGLEGEALTARAMDILVGWIRAEPQARGDTAQSVLWRRLMQSAPPEIKNQATTWAISVRAEAAVAMLDWPEADLIAAAAGQAAQQDRGLNG